MFLYIDPGTGSMLFTILISIFGAAFYLVRTLFVKLKFVFTGGKKVDKSKDRLPFVIYSDDKRYWNIFKPICDEFIKRGKSVVYYTSSEDDPALNYNPEFIKAEFIGDGNKAFARLNVLNAAVVLSTTPSLDVFGWKRSDFVLWYVHIPHMANDITTYRMFGLDHYDAILLSGEYQKRQIRKLEELRKLPAKEIELVGIPYMDVMKARVEKAGKPEAHTRTVLLAPSWGKSGILSKFGERAIDALLATGYKIIIRPHPQSFKSEKEMLDRLMAKYPDSDKISWNRDTDNFEVLRNSDILISDFSGVIFDFTLIFDKPVIYADTSFDKSPYDAWWLDEELWTFEILPEMGLKLTEEGLSNIKELIDKCIEDPSFKAGRDKARSETWVHEGEGAVRTADYLFAKYDDLMAAEEEKKRKEEAEFAALLEKKKKKAEKKAAKKAKKAGNPEKPEEQTINQDKQ